jgi:hypothetical protein
MAAPTKKVFGKQPASAKAALIRFKAVLAVFQCSSAPAGSIPPLSSPRASYAFGTMDAELSASSSRHERSEMSMFFLTSGTLTL